MTAYVTDVNPPHSIGFNYNDGIADAVKDKIPNAKVVSFNNTTSCGKSAATVTLNNFSGDKLDTSKLKFYQLTAKADGTYTSAAIKVSYTFKDGTLVFKTTKAGVIAIGN